MKKQIQLILLSLTLLFSCAPETKDISSIVEISPYSLSNIEEVQPKIQLFSISIEMDTVLKTLGGSFIYIDSLAFMDANSNVVTGLIDIQIVEAVSLSEILRCNLSTIGESGFLESDGMIFINAKQGGKQLSFRSNKQILIYLKNENSKNEMTAWTTDNTGGAMVWNETNTTLKYLTLVEFKDLDFTVHSSNQGYKIVKGGNIPDSLTETEALNQGLIIRDTIISNCGLSNNYIQLLKSQNFQKTLISTREFENRMQYIHQTCDVEVLQLYLENLDLNLWEIDSLAFEYLKRKESSIQNQFEIFYKQKLTRVKEGNLASVKINQAISNFKKAKLKQKEDAKTGSMFYSFYTRNLGWNNIDKYWKRSDLENVLVKINISTTKEITKSQLQITIPTDKVVLPLRKNVNKNSFILDPFNDLKRVKLPLQKKALISGILITTEKELYFIYEEFVIEKSSNITVNLTKSSIEEIITKFELTDTVNINPESVNFNCCDLVSEGTFSGSVNW